MVVLLPGMYTGPATAVFYAALIGCTLLAAWVCREEIRESLAMLSQTQRAVVVAMLIAIVLVVVQERVSAEAIYCDWDRILNVMCSGDSWCAYAYWYGSGCIVFGWP